jgi:hypothetical protein
MFKKRDSAPIYFVLDTLSPYYYNIAHEGFDGFGLSD